MELTKEEQSMLDGEEGEGVQKAVEILLALGKIYDAGRFIPVSSAQVAGVSYKNLGDAGLEFLEDWANKGAKVRIPTTLNPAGIDIENWKKLGISDEFAQKQIRVIEAYKSMGIQPSCTCTPYLAGNLPKQGEHVAWSESSAVSYANSVIGARTNREGGPSALAAAIAGRTPEYGLHLDEDREPNLLVEVKCELNSISDFGALGYIIGKEAGNSIPYFKGIKQADSDSLKSLGAAMAASGAVALYHVEGITPEAKLGTTSTGELGTTPETLTIENLDDGYKSLNSDAQDIDLIAIGCPHASLNELKKISNLLDGKKIKSELWITTSRKIMLAAGNEVAKIESSGAKVVADTCMIVAPVEELGFKTMATNAGKAAFYAPSHCNLNVRFGTLEQCINAAITGKWS
ncbi:MAG: aconitase X catalytic domain-containing protein [Candidatus Altiarchaeota archaeon]|nr:aconitase X catalytic domain-containing protein [Candidatus Altiarchaeota archaeon]